MPNRELKIGMLIGLHLSTLVSLAKLSTLFKLVYRDYINTFGNAIMTFQPFAPFLCTFVLFTLHLQPALPPQQIDHHNLF